MLDIFEEPVVGLEGLVSDLAVGADALVGELDGDAGVEVGELAESVREGVVVVGCVGEDGVVGFEDDGGAGCAFGVVGDLADIVEGGGDDATLEGHGLDLAVAPDLDLKEGGEGVDTRDAHAVEPAGDLVGRSLLLELAAGVELGEDDLDGGLAVGVWIVVLDGVGGNTSPVVGDLDGAVGLDDDRDEGGVVGHGLVDGVVDDLVDEVVERVEPGATDVHAGAFADGLKPLEDLDLV